MIIRKQHAYPRLEWTHYLREKCVVFPLSIRNRRCNMKTLCPLQHVVVKSYQHSSLNIFFENKSHLVSNCCKVGKWFLKINLLKAVFDVLATDSRCRLPICLALKSRQILDTLCSTKCCICCIVRHFVWM